MTATVRHLVESLWSSGRAPTTGSDRAAAYAFLASAGHRRIVGPVEAALDVVFATEVQRAVATLVDDGGWVVTSSRTGSVELERDGLRIHAPHTRIVGAVGDGSTVALRTPAVSTAVSPGYLHRRGGLEGTKPVSRVYINVRPPDAWVVLGPVVESLTDTGIECDAKVLGHPSNYHRTDSGVVYVPSEVERRAVRLIARTLHIRRVRLDAPVPFLTKRIARGLAVADDPTDLAPQGEMSHGQWVTRVLVDAIAGGTVDRNDLVRRIVEVIRRDGRDPERPYRRGVSANQLAG